MSQTASPSDQSQDILRPVRIWLYVLAVLILIMVAVGGATRLTDSGLSITEWKPISGMIPPLTMEDWQAELEAYRQIPEYQLINKGMSLEEFKFIFWWEWGHRFLGRIIGLVFAIPFVIFLFQKRLNWQLAPSLFILFLLGGFQGFLGWWMVSSGLTERVDVSQYRLATHLSAACILFLAIVWVVRRLRQVDPIWVEKGWRPVMWLFGGMVFIQLIAGAFVAGMDAGLTYNTWPLMDGALIPDNIYTSTPAWLDAFEDITTAQFNHRTFAYVIAIFAAFLLYKAWKNTQFAGVHGWMLIIGALVLVQILLGIFTLIYVVPLGLALAHQITAFLLLGSIVAYLADMKAENKR
ncbi:cytochrome c oxidase assembly protein subunit 15 [Maritalea mobilis]|uniref:Heme A synthase n=1 Tax=Maritalea mobilis TaxID=483324 RepID=A0A4R6VQ83_9HYPH|nr:COX15/CtaA family protein [Maritalea mobilis]TDQ66159.1 cytochrome c oxidase assembly protein subunit 15 [Maritalea mobilis]